MRVVGRTVGPVWVIIAMLATLLTLSASPVAAADGANCLLTANGAQVSLTWSVPGGVNSSTAIRSGTSLADTSWRETVPNTASSWTGDLRVDEVYLVKTKIDGVRTEIPCNEQPEQPELGCSYGSNEVEVDLTTIRWNVGDEGRVAVRSGPSADETGWRATVDAATGEWTTRLSAEQAWVIRYRVGEAVTTFECVFEDREVEPVEPPPPLRAPCTVRIIEGKANLTILVGAGPVAIRSGPSVDNTKWRETVGRGEGWSGEHTPGHVYLIRYKTEGENREVLCEPGEADGVFFANHMPNSRAWAELPNGSIVYSRSTTEFGTEPWVTDGTVEGTEPLGDLRPGGSSQPMSFARFGDFVFFTASTAETGRELWRTDGTAAGTVVLDLTPGPASVGPSNLSALDGQLFFGSLGSSWVSDGTIEGTRELPSPIRGYFRNVHATDSGFYIRTRTDNRNDLWWVDQDLVEAHLVRAGVVNTFNSISTDGDRLFLAGPNGVSVFGGDGVLLTTLPFHGEDRFRSTDVSAAPGGAYIIGQRLDDSWTVWFSDGTAAGSEILVQTERPEDGGPIFLITVGTVGSRVVYSRFFEDRQEDIWSVGVESPTPERIRGLEGTAILRSQAVNDDELFIDSGIVTDGTTAGTTAYDVPGFSFVYYWNDTIYLLNQVGMFGINR